MSNVLEAARACALRTLQNRNSLKLWHAGHAFPSRLGMIVFSARPCESHFLLKGALHGGCCGSHERSADGEAQEPSAPTP